MSLALVFNTSTPGQPRLYLISWHWFSTHRLLDNRDSTLSLALVFNTSDSQNRRLDNRDSTFSWHWFSTHRLLDNRDSTFSLALVFNTSTPGQPRLYLAPGTGFQHIRLLDNRDSTLSLALVFNTSTLRIDSGQTETLPCFLSTSFQHIDSQNRLLEGLDSTLFPGTGFQQIDYWTTVTLPSLWRWFSTHKLSE